METLRGVPWEVVALAWMELLADKLADWMCASLEKEKVSAIDLQGRATGLQNAA